MEEVEEVEEVYSQPYEAELEHYEEYEEGKPMPGDNRSPMGSAVRRRFDHQSSHQRKTDSWKYYLPS
jgi:hypothetical protein